MDFSSETFTVDRGEFRYSSGPLVNQRTGVPAKFSIPLTTLVLDFHQLPYIPMGPVRNLVGKINNATFLGATTGCVLFKGCKTTRENSSNGDVAQKVQFVFEERSARHPWNSLPSRKKLTWYPVEDSDGIRMYETGDFSTLLSI